MARKRLNSRPPHQRRRGRIPRRQAGGERRTRRRFRKSSTGPDSPARPIDMPAIGRALEMPVHVAAVAQRCLMSGPLRALRGAEHQCVYTEHTEAHPRRATRAQRTMADGITVRIGVCIPTPPSRCRHSVSERHVNDNPPWSHASRPHLEDGYTENVAFPIMCDPTKL